jgi:CBS domain containing-hemolysin-like protein
LRLNTSQNDLLIASVSITILTCSVSMGAYIAGAFGMNLDNTINGILDFQNSFTIVTTSSFGLIVTAFICIFGYLRHSGFIPSRIAPDAIVKAAVPRGINN